MESPRSCPTRLCRTEGSPQHSVETPARVARPSGPLWGSAPRIQRCRTGNRRGGSHLRTRRGGGAACGARGGMRDSWDWSAPMHAAEKGHATCVELLAEKEEGMETTRGWFGCLPGTAALDIARWKGFTAIASILSG